METDPTVMDRPRRRFTMRDSMVAVAASAATLGFFRGFEGTSTTRPWIDAANLTVRIIVSVALAWTPAVLILRLCQPRPNLRRLSRQPGFVATITGTTILGLSLIAMALVGAIRAFKAGKFTASGSPALRPHPEWPWEISSHFVGNIGVAVLTAWLLLLVSGRRKPERGWLDPLGRALGIVWIVLFVINACVKLARTIE